MTLTHTFLQNASEATSKNHWLYRKALAAGASISQLTSPGEVILLAKKSGEDLFAAFFGAIITGRVPLIIQRPSPKVHQFFFEKRMLDLKQQVNATICLCELQDMEKFIPFFKCHNQLAPSLTDCTVVLPQHNDLAFIQMSSGTTGVSKICEVTHGQVLAHCLAYGRIIGMDKTKSVVSWLPLYHDMGLIAAFLLPIIHDAEFHIIDPFDWLMNPKSLIELTDAHKGTHCWMPSFAFNHMAKKVPLEMVKHLKLDSLERVISCSEPTFYDDLANFRDKFASVGLKSTALCVCYALAENIFAVSQSDTIEETEWKGAKYTSCGNVLEQVSVRIIRDGMDVTTKDDGTVMISSPFEPRTNKKSEGYYNTGDIGFFKDQKLYIIGREKDLFVSYGVNVYPEIIEHLVANIEGVVPGRVVCFGVHSKEQGTNKVVVCVETENVGNNKLRTELSAIIREEFGLTAIVILVVPGSLIKTSSGKFCRIKNKEAYGNINA